ncbi:MAG: hypothetical protein LBG28_12220 [Tannerella sp.]|jgi:hypothetical protein|nr:hypothetical protein [Tannerella sp.]
MLDIFDMTFINIINRPLSILQRKTAAINLKSQFMEGLVLKYGLSVNNRNTCSSVISFSTFPVQYSSVTPFHTSPKTRRPSTTYSLQALKKAPSPQDQGSSPQDQYFSSQGQESSFQDQRSSSKDQDFSPQDQSFSSWDEDSSFQDQGFSFQDQDLLPQDRKISAQDQSILYLWQCDAGTGNGITPENVIINR